MADGLRIIEQDFHSAEDFERWRAAHPDAQIESLDAHQPTMRLGSIFDREPPREVPSGPLTIRISWTHTFTHDAPQGR